MTTTDSRTTTVRAQKAPAKKAPVPKVPAQGRARKPARPAGPAEAVRPAVPVRPAGAGRRYHLDTEIKKLTPAMRADQGRQLRSLVPRSSHAQLDAGSGRPDPIEALEGQSASREPDLVPIRYGRMLASPFAYFRGAALPMANDLSATPVTGIAVQACGDAHIGNFGLFGTAERRMMFDINDFDETTPGPWEWDVKRLAASLEIAARDRGIGVRTRRAMVRGAIGRYRLTMAMLAGQPNLDVW